MILLVLSASRFNSFEQDEFGKNIYSKGPNSLHPLSPILNSVSFSPFLAAIQFMNTAIIYTQPVFDFKKMNPGYFNPEYFLTQPATSLSGYFSLQNYSIYPGGLVKSWQALPHWAD